MIVVTLDAEAEEEITHAAAWYEQRGHAGLGERFVDAIGTALDEICEQPESFPTLLTERGVVVRRHLVRDFPYQVGSPFATERRVARGVGRGVTKAADARDVRDRANGIHVRRAHSAIEWIDAERRRARRAHDRCVSQVSVRADARIECDGQSP
jgi:hypothetical protein